MALELAQQGLVQNISGWDPAILGRFVSFPAHVNLFCPCLRFISNCTDSTTHRDESPSGDLVDGERLRF